MRTLVLLILSLFVLQSHSHAQNFTQEERSLAGTLLLMEDEMQLFSESEFYRGANYYMTIQDEWRATKNRKECEAYHKKYGTILEKMDEINSRTAEVISYIDNLKKELLEKSKSNVDSYQIYKKEQGQPDRIILYGLKNPLAESIITDSIGLFRKVQQFQDSLLFCGTNYTFNGKTFRFNNFPRIQSYSSRREVLDLYRNVLSIETVNRDDVYAMAEIGADLRITLSKIFNGRRRTLIQNLSLLTVIQKDVLTQRARALGHWKSKIGYCRF